MYEGKKAEMSHSLTYRRIVRFSSFCSLILSLWLGWFEKAEPRTYHVVVARKNGEVDRPAR